MLNLGEFIKSVHQNAVDHGWHEKERAFGEEIALCHSELSEALEEFRKGKKPNETYYKCTRKDNSTCAGHGEMSYMCEGCCDRKPEGIPSELADVIIRIFDMCGRYGIDMETMLIEKHKFNRSRPYKHGGKVI